MKYLPLAIIILLSSTSSYSHSAENTDAPSATKISSESLNYSSGGYAEVVIQKPVSYVFNILTNINSWPEINKGVTQKIEPKNIKAAKGKIFEETIASPIPGIKDWTNQWTIEEYQPNQKFVISGVETFASVPIHSRITYEFSKKTDTETGFRRAIDVTLDRKFVEGASKQEVEALYRFLGSQWEMANHLKTYVESK